MIRVIKIIFFLVLTISVSYGQVNADSSKAHRRIRDTLKLKLRTVESYYSGNRAAVYEYKGKRVTKIKMLSDSIALFETKKGKLIRGKIWLNYKKCGKCLPAGTLISCPRGEVEISKLKSGDSIYTSNEKKEKISTIIQATDSVSITRTHKMIKFILEDGRILLASAEHPSADYFPLDYLKIGDKLDGSVIIYKKAAACIYSKTYDILPVGKTGTYWANGILIGSTLHASFPEANEIQ
jgi:hypothetical protein